MSINDYTGIDDEAELARRAPYTVSLVDQDDNITITNCTWYRDGKLVHPPTAEACSEFLEDPDNDPFAFFQGLVWAVVLVAAAFALAVIITHAISASQTL